MGGCLVEALDVALHVEEMVDYMVGTDLVVLVLEFLLPLPIGRGRDPPKYPWHLDRGSGVSCVVANYLMVLASCWCVHFLLKMPYACLRLL